MTPEPTETSAPATEPTPAADHAPVTTLLLGVKTRPAGVGVTGSLMVPVVTTKSLSVSVGPYAALYYYWYEADAQVRLVALGGFAVLGIQGGVEPGAYLPLATRESGEKGWGSREFSLRGIGRATLELNLRNDHAWLYTRTIGLARGHRFAEYDPYRDLELLGTELSGEQAVAAMVAPFGAWSHTPAGRDPYKAYAWLYGEGIFNGIAAGTPDHGATDTSAHVGVILEQVIPKLYLDLDGYWSFGPSAKLAGPGALVVLTYSG